MRPPTTLTVSNGDGGSPPATSSDGRMRHPIEEHGEQALGYAVSPTVSDVGVPNIAKSTSSTYVYEIMDCGSRNCKYSDSYVPPLVSLLRLLLNNKELLK